MQQPDTSTPYSFEFRQDGIFHPYVGSLLTAITSLFVIADPERPIKFDPQDRIHISGVLTSSRSISAHEVQQHVLNQDLPHDYYCTNLCIMLTNTAYAVAEPYNDKGPVFEFFRHLRNASSHGNRFNFHPKEPSRLAAWRNASIDHTKRGKDNPLYGTVCFGQYFGFADILDLLWDVEQLILPQIRPASRD
jgi:hypothetical protein